MTIKQSILSQRELQQDTLNYPEALKQRAVPCRIPMFILLGEMRDLETMGAALTASADGSIWYSPPSIRLMPSRQ